MEHAHAQRPHRLSGPWWVQRCLVWFISLGLVLSGTGTPWMVRAQAAEDLRANIGTAFDRLDRVLAAAEEDVDPVFASLDELSFAVAFEDPGTIVDWVRTNIFFEPYLGLLRGPDGTLAARAGNALDQAVLLATLLNDAGYEAEVARAELPSEAARQLIDGLDPSVFAGTRGGVDRAPADLAALSEISGLSVQELERLQVDTIEELDSSMQEAEQVSSDVRAALAVAGIEVAAGDMRDEMVEEAQDYFFVRWRTSSEGSWTHAHPAFSESVDALSDLAPDETYAESIPDEVQHRVRVQMFVEQKQGDALDVRPVTAAWERPAANLVRQPLRIANLANGFAAVDDANDLQEALNATTFFMPRFADRAAPGAMSFDLKGNVVPADATMSAAAGVFQQVGEAVGEAAGALGGLGGDGGAENPKDFVTLSGVWIDYTLIAPGGAEATHRRMLLDRIGPVARASGTAELRPMDEIDVFTAVQEPRVVMVSVGPMSDDYLAWHTTQEQRRANDLLREKVYAVLDGTASPTPSSELAQAEATVGYLLLQGIFDGYQPETAMRVQTAPRLVVMSRSLDGSTARSDIVSDAERVVGAGGVARPVDAVTAGVWRTMVEALPLRNGAAKVQHVFASLEAAEREGIATIVLGPGESDRLDELQLPEDSLAAIRADLADGFAVIAPARPPESVPEPAWWRVDPNTGATLGRGGDGRGQTMVEYFSTEISIGITVAFALIGQYQCDQIEDPAAAGCCMVQNVALAGLGVGIGAALAGVWAALKVFVVMDVGYNLAGAVGLFDVCSVIMEFDRRDPEVLDAEAA